MDNEEKARTIIGEDCKKENCLQCGGRYSAEKGGCAKYQKIMQMAQWKDEQLVSAIDKVLERNGYFLKQGKITQYGYDMAFATIQNIREYLKQL